LKEKEIKYIQSVPFPFKEQKDTAGTWLSHAKQDNAMFKNVVLGLY
jgi:hypothetical protein